MARRLSALTFAAAESDDVAAVAAVRTRAAQRLTSEHGAGHWSHPATEASVVRDMKDGVVLVARKRNDVVVTDGIARKHNDVVATLALAKKKPWAIDVRSFSRSTAPLYLHHMAVAPDAQRRGVGRALLDEAANVARARGADAIRLDAYDAAAGAGGFYARCGYVEVGRVTYRQTPLIYFERLLP